VPVQLGRRSAVGQKLRGDVHDGSTIFRFIHVPVSVPALVPRSVPVSVSVPVPVRGDRTDVVALGNVSDDRTPQVEPLGNRPDRRDVPGADLVAHPLLGLGQEDLDGVHPGFPLVDDVETEVGSQPALCSHLAGRTPQAGGTQVPSGLDQVAVEENLVGLDQQFLRVRVTHLYGGAVFGFGVLVEVLARERRPAQAVPARCVAHQHQSVSRFGRRPGHQSVGGHQPNAPDVDQWISLVVRVKVDATGHRRHADGVPVVGDPLDDALEQVPGVLAVERPEVQRIRQRDRVRPHRHDVPDDAPDAGGRPVVRVDVRGVVVALYPDREIRLTVARKRHDGGVVAGSDHDPVVIGPRVERPE